MELGDRVLVYPWHESVNAGKHGEITNVRRVPGASYYDVRFDDGSIGSDIYFDHLSKEPAPSKVERLEARIAELEAALIPAIRLCHQANKSLLAHRSDSFRDCDSPVCRNATRALKGDADERIP